MKRTVLLAQINPGLQIIGTPPTVFPGVPFSFTFTSRGGVAGTYRFTQTGTLPTGLSFTDNGDGSATLAGTVALADAGDYPITVTLGNSGQFAVAEDFTLTVPALTLQLVQTGVIYKGVALTAGQLKLVAHGGTGAGYAYAITSGTPAGLTLNTSTGELTGTPTAQTTYTVVGTVTDSASNSATVTAQVVTQTTLYGIDVTPDYCEAPFLYSYQLSIGGATGSVTYSIASGSLPVGLSVNSAGLITGTPSEFSGLGQTHTCVINAADAGTGCTLPISVSMYQGIYETVGAAPTYTIATNVPTTLNNGQYGGAMPITYQQNFSSSTTNGAITVAL